ncbi:MAG: ABC transporter ATP-binding protein [Rhodobacteraceae bacterium]|nr:ABC transporter ATP-binding protein [Paracoccaceae bacterium]
MSQLTLRSVFKSFGATAVVRDFKLTMRDGEFLSLLGPSGCGKTTVLRMVAGFESPSAGQIEIDGRDVTHLRPAQRNIGMMFQAYALFPNMTVGENVAFGLKVKGVGRDEREARVADMLRLIGLPDLGARYPFQLSGGQQQRVALARALAPQPKVLLLDEPLSALDAKVRVSLRTEIRQIQQEMGITTIFVTHDQEEAMSISDRIVVMNGGVADQIGTPFEIYNRPTTRFVANFVGTLNTFEVKVVDPALGRVTLADQPLTLSDRPLGARAGDTLSIALRPEALRLGRSDAHETTLPARIDDVHFMGSVIRLRAMMAGVPVSLDTFNRPDVPPPVPGSMVEVSLSGHEAIVLNG